MALDPLHGHGCNCDDCVMDGTYSGAEEAGDISEQNPMRPENQ